MGFPDVHGIDAKNSIEHMEQRDNGFPTKLLFSVH